MVCVQTAVLVRFPKKRGRMKQSRIKMKSNALDDDKHVWKWNYTVDTSFEYSCNGTNG